MPNIEKGDRMEISPIGYGEFKIRKVNLPIIGGFEEDI